MAGIRNQLCTEGLGEAASVAVSVSLSLTELTAGVAKEVSMRGPNLLLGKRGPSSKNPLPFLNLRSPHSRDFRGKLPPLPRSTERSAFSGPGEVLPESGKTRPLGRGVGERKKFGHILKLVTPKVSFSL